MAALYDPRYDYPDHSAQRTISSFPSPQDRSAILSIKSLLKDDLPAQADPLDNFRINDPNFQNTAAQLANRAYLKARNRGLSHLDALKAMEKGPMGLSRELLSVTGTEGDMHGYIRPSIRDDLLRHRPERLLPPPAQATPALQNGAPAEPKAALEHPKPYMHSAIANDPLLQLMAGGNKKRLGPVETYRFFKTLDPAVQQQHASRIDGSHLAKLEKREAMGGGGTEYGNLDGTVTSESVQYESGDPIDALQDLYAAQNNAQSNPDRSYRDMSQGAQEARGALASVNTGIDTEVTPVSQQPISQLTSLGEALKEVKNRLPDFLSGLTYDALGYLTGTSAEAVRANGISLRVDGDEFFAFDGENTVSIDAKTAEAINAANNDVATQDPTAITGPFMGGYGQESLPPAPALTTPSTDTKAPQTDKGILTDSALSKPTQSTVRSTTGGYTGNARGSDLPDMQIGLNERLMRMGAAGLAAGGQGSLAQMGAMFGASSDVNQANRQGAMDTFKIEEERRQAHADRVAALAASKNKGAGDLSKVKDFQGKSFGFYNRGVDAERILSQLDGQGTEFWKTVGSKVPIFGNALVGSEYRQYDQARRNFVNAVLRRESGAVISEEEFDNANKQYFPQFGDEESEILQKRQNRRTTMLGIRISAGDTMQYTSDYPTSGLVTQIGNMKITTK